MRIFVALILLLGLTTPAQARDRSRTPNYKGKVYQEIRVDDNGIFLIDSLGNETEVPSDRGTGEEGDVQEPETPEPPINITFNPPAGLYTDTIDGISRIGGSVIVEPNEYVLGDVMVIGGNATIKGRVSGTVTATGTVQLSPTAFVEGNVTGSPVMVESGSHVGGDISGKESGVPFPETDGAARNQENSFASAMQLLTWILIEFLIVLGLAMMFRKAADRIKEAYHANIFKMLLVGFLAEIFLLPTMIILIITIIGIPVALIALPLGVVAATFLGLAAFCLFVSDFVKSKDQGTPESRWKKVLTGFAILNVPMFGVWIGLTVGSEPMWIVSTIIASILFFIVLTASLGAALLTRFGFRNYRGARVIVEVSGGKAVPVTERAVAAGVKTVNARIAVGGGRLVIAKGTGDGGTVAELTGDYNSDKFSYDYAFNASSDQADLSFSTEARSKNLSGLEGKENDWKIALSPDIGFALDLNLGAAKATVDFSDLAVTKLDLDVGAADAHLDFPTPNKSELKLFKVDAGACKLKILHIGNSRFDRLEFDGGVGKFMLDFTGEFNFQAEANISVGLGSLSIVLPNHIGVRLQADNKWLSSIDFARHKLVWVAGQGGVYQTENYESAAGRLNLSLEIGLGSADLQFK